MKKLLLLLVCAVLLQGCVFSGYGVKYETGNYMATTAKNGDKSFNVVVSVKEQPGALYAVSEKIAKMFKEWCE